MLAEFFEKKPEETNDSAFHMLHYQIAICSVTTAMCHERKPNLLFTHNAVKGLDCLNEKIITS